VLTFNQLMGSTNKKILINLAKYKFSLDIRKSIQI